MTSPLLLHQSISLQNSDIHENNLKYICYGKIKHLNDILENFDNKITVKRLSKTKWIIVRLMSNKHKVS